MPFLEKGEVKVHYAVWDEGTGPWLVLVNGYTRTLTDFRAMAKYLSQRGLRVITFDNRGAGKAETPLGFSIDDIGDDILDLLDHFGANQSHLLGISYGGVIAAKLAARSERISKLILVSTPISIEFLHSEVKGPSRDPRRFHSDLTQYFSKDFFSKNKLLVDGFFRATIKTFQEPDTALGARAQRDSMAEMDLTPELSKIQVPTFILQGEADRIVDRKSAEMLKVGIKNSTLKFLPGIGHLLLAECPVEFYEMVNQWIGIAQGN